MADTDADYETSVDTRRSRSHLAVRAAMRATNDPAAARAFARQQPRNDTLLQLKSYNAFLFCKSFPPQPFLFLLQDSLHGFPRLFTVISEHICFLLFSFSLFLHFLVVGSVR